MINPVADGLKIPELKRRALITLGLLFVFRLGCQVTVPGVNAAAIRELMQSQAGGVLGLVNMFSGGALQNASVFALGIMPYISVSIILQLLTEVWPYLKQLKNEGESGRRKITQYTRYGTVALALFQGFMITNLLRSFDGSSAQTVILNDTLSWQLITALTLTTGTLMVMWLGEQITEFGIGNGMSLVIFIGIIAQIPSQGYSLYQNYDAGNLSFFGLLFFLAVMAALVMLTVVVQLSFRKIAVQYAQRQQGRRMMAGGATTLPLKVDYSGVIAVIFASSLLIFPQQIIEWARANAWMGQNEAAKASLDVLQSLFRSGGAAYSLIYAGLIIFFCYFYTAMVFNTDDVADNMKKYGGFIPGLRPGKSTAEYLARVLDRITLWGALSVVIIAVIPDLLAKKMNVSLYLGGTTLLIMVGVALDTMRQVESHLLMRQYDGFMKAGKIKGRFG